jgi:hypothetical protein
MKQDPFTMTACRQIGFAFYDLLKVENASF